MLNSVCVYSSKGWKCTATTKPEKTVPGDSLAVVDLHRKYNGPDGGDLMINETQSLPSWNLLISKRYCSAYQNHVNKK